MVKIDKKDREILYQLDVNARQSLRSIGSKVGISKSVVQYRIDRMIAEGIIKNFYTSIDFYRLGYINLGIYVTYQYYTPKIEQEIINYFKATDFTWFIANIQGKFDLICLFAVKNLNQFYSFWKQTLSKYRYHFQESVLSFFTRTHYFPSSYLLDTNHELERAKHEIIDGGEPIAIDDKDIQILQHISLNARKPLLEIAEDIQASATLVSKRIKMLQKQQVIKGFRLNIDYAKLGLQLFNVQFNLKHYDRIHDIIRFIKSHPNVISISEVIDYYDLSINVHIKDFYELHILIKSIYNTFPEDIKNHMTFSYPEIFKYNYMPTLHI